MFEFIRKLFKREEPKRIPGVTYAEVDRVPIKRIEVKKFEPKMFNASEVENPIIWMYQYTDTGEIVEKPNYEAVDEILNTNRPVMVLGSIVK